MLKLNWKSSECWSICTQNHWCLGLHLLIFFFIYILIKHNFPNQLINQALFFPVFFIYCLGKTNKTYNNISISIIYTSLLWYINNKIKKKNKISNASSEKRWSSNAKELHWPRWIFEDALMLIMLISDALAWIQSDTFVLVWVADGLLRLTLVVRSGNAGWR